MESQGTPVLPLATLSLHAFAPTGVAAPRAIKPHTAAAPTRPHSAHDGPRSHPITADSGVAPAPGHAARPAHQPRSKAGSSVERIVSAIPAALSRIVTTPVHQGPFTGPARLSDVRIFPSAIPRRAGRGGSTRPGGGGGRGPVLVWFRTDLRLHDQPALARACREGSSVLPVYVIDPRDFQQAPGGFPRTGPARARFLLESLADLRSRLRAAGSELVLGRGRPEAVLPELAERVGAAAVYCCAEVAAEEAQVEARVRSALERRGAELRTEWGGTLFHLEDLPFRLDCMPGTYAEFRSRLLGRAVRAPLDSEAGIKGLPAGCSIEPGELPSLQQLGVSPAPSNAAAASTTSSGGGSASLSQPVVGCGPVLRGGEGEALRHLRAFVEELKASASKERHPAGAKPGAAASSSAADASAPSSSAFSCRISPWLALGCLSPRTMYHEMRAQLGGGQHLLRPAAAQQQQARGQGQQRGQQGQQGAGGPANWLMFELLWRDFFRFMTQKYTAAASAAPGKAGRAAGPTGAAASAVAPAPALALATA